MDQLQQLCLNLEVKISTAFTQEAKDGKVNFAFDPKTITIRSLSNEEDPTEFWALRSINGRDYELTLEKEFADVINAEGMTIAQLLAYAYNMTNYNSIENF